MGLRERKEREKLERKEQILTAARKLLFEKGLKGTSINQIAKNAELGVGTIYFYYPSKEELFAALQEEGLEILHQRIIIAVKNAKSPEGRLKAIADAYLKFSQADKNYFDIINYFLSSPEVVFAPNLKEQVDQHGNRILAVVEGAIASGVENGRFRSVELRKNAVLFWATLHGVIQFKKLQNTILKGVSHQDLYAHAVDEFIDQLRL